MVGSENQVATAHPMLLACPNCTTTYEVKADLIGESGRALRCARCQNVWHATRSQELILTTQPVDAGSVVPQSSPAPESPPATPAAENTADATSAASPDQTPDQSALSAQDADNSPPSVDAPPLAPAAPSLIASPGTAPLPPEGEDIESFARRQADIMSSRSRALRAQFGPPAIIVALALIITALVAWRTSIVRMAPQMASLYGAIGLPVNLRELIFSDVRITREARDGVPVLLVEGFIKSTSKNPVDVPRLRFGLRNQAGLEIYSWFAVPERSILSPGETQPFRSRLASPPSEGHDVVVRFFNRHDAIEGAR
jgi:predicted Zn finger-like uncharacterized protein